jgi:hypothetical protein
MAYAESNDALTTETVYLTKLANKDLAPVGMALRLSSGRRHAHSPELARARAGLQAVWLEDESQELDAATQVLSSRIEGTVASSPSELDLGEYSASSATVFCEENSCRVVAAAREGSQRAVLLGGTLAGSVSNKAASLRVLAELDATGLLAAPALLDSAVFLGDVGRAGRGWVQRVEVNW